MTEPDSDDDFETDDTEETAEPFRLHSRWLAVGALVAALLAVVGAPASYGFSLVLAPVALALGKMAVADPDAQIGGDGVAKAGYWLGIGGTVALVVWFGYQAVTLS